MRLARKFVAMTSIDWLRTSFGLMPFISITCRRKRSAQLPRGVASTLPSSHVTASSADLNAGASDRTMITLQRCPAERPVLATSLILACFALVVDTTAGMSPR